MKIAMPVTDNMGQADICISFGRTPFFLIYDTDTNQSVFLDNAAAASQGGAGIKAAQAVVDAGAKALITPRCGENAATVLITAGVKIYKSIGNSIEENINSFKSDNLDVLSEIHAGLHNHGGSSK